MSYIIKRLTMKCSRGPMWASQCHMEEFKIIHVCRMAYNKKIRIYDVNLNTNHVYHLNTQGPRLVTLLKD